MARAAPPVTDGGTFVPGGPARDLGPWIKRGDDRTCRLNLMVEGVHCGGCVRRIERRLQAEADVAEARLNLTTRRLVVAWEGAVARGGELVGLIEAMGYRALPFDPDRLASGEARTERELLHCMAIAGFAAANVMLLSVSVWAGHATGMGQATRDLLHWFSALIALPAIVWCGRPFFCSAARALAAGGTNMDVPISVGVTLTAAMSLHETFVGGPHAYFDAAVALLFFLLVGRYLDHRARGRARHAVERLMALGQSPVNVQSDDGTTRVLPPEQVRTGMTVLVAAGERIGVDGRVVTGRSELDTSLITGETLPARVGPGDPVFAGTLNLGGPLSLEVGATGEGTLLADIVRLMEVAEQRRGRFVAIADRVARLYTPVVHLLALGTFLGWLLLAGAVWQHALLIAVAVLIVTCPCALGLAVPAVQVIASGRLLRQGILLKSATALERFARVDRILFDKTGTLTLGRPELVDRAALDADALRVAATLAGASHHPLARALVRAMPGVPVAAGVREVHGQGLALATRDGEIRLGRRGFAAEVAEDERAGPELWLARPGHLPLRFAFEDRLRADALAVVAELRRRGFAVELLSGDRAPTVAAIADALRIAEWRAGCTPDAKCARLAELDAAGHRTLMVGDGLNDAPALAAAHASISPSSAVDISQTAADAVFQGERLAPVLELLATARRSERLVRQNFALAFVYNALAVPVAIAGLVTPLLAAIFMSASSLVVVGNALRLGLVRRRWTPSSG